MRASATCDAFAEIAARHGRLDILVNNTGGTVRKPVLETPDEDWQSLIDLDLTACFRMAREALRLMVPQKSGRIIMISSIMGHLARPTIPAYVAAKTGLHGLVRALAVEFGRHNVTINAIAPGYFAVPGNQSLRDDGAFNASGLFPRRRWRAGAIRRSLAGRWCFFRLAPRLS
jgi:gluconate 5-dehydrogenase